MVLIKCPECGKENVSGSAENKKEKSSLYLICIIVLLVIAATFYAIYQSGKCESRNCDGRAMKNGRYCEKHTCTIDGCYNYKDGWSNVCETHHQENLKRLEEDNSIEELKKELIEK